MQQGVQTDATCNSNNVGSVAAWIERWTCNSEAPSSSPALTASWICSWQFRVQILVNACKCWFASGQLGFLTLLSVI